MQLANAIPSTPLELILSATVATKVVLVVLAVLSVRRGWDMDNLVAPTTATLGDVITIPAKTPHWWKDTSKTGSVGYYAVNIEQ